MISFDKYFFTFIFTCDHSFSFVHCTFPIIEKTDRNTSRFNCNIILLIQKLLNIYKDTEETSKSSRIISKLNCNISNPQFMVLIITYTLLYNYTYVKKILHNSIYRLNINLSVDSIISFTNLHLPIVKVYSIHLYKFSRFY